MAIFTRLSLLCDVVWRSVIVSRPAKLRRDRFALVVEQEQVARVPFEDIAVIVLNHREITLTHPVLSACGEYGIGLFSTGDNHQPNGVFTPFLPHSRATRMLRLQLKIDRPRAKRAWARIVRAKIENQAASLTLAGKDGADRLQSYARRVRSGDVGRMEPQAAAFYFRRLFGTDFDREKRGWINSALDYGYAVMRGAIARGLVAHGLLPSLGLFHGNEQNAFNLADDLIEPFRPLVDLHVATNARAPAEPEPTELCPADKAALVALLHVDVRMPRGEMTVLAAIEQATESLARLFNGGSDDALELPRVIGLRRHRLEA
ncbi:MAG: type II CRISPR-associated endonuclease Cas1 [Casimicrobiaceae bacterium]|nr:type II CRISPR-associated endonuclease Cas1 [Casimicrobiaceae bacterium]